MSAVAAPVTKLPFQKAVEARDLDALVEAFTPDAVIHGPNSDAFLVRGRDEIRTLYRANFEAFPEVRFTEELRSASGDSAVLMARMTIDGTDVEIADHMRLDEQGRVRQLTVFFRPMAGLAVASRTMAAALGRQRSPLRGRIMAALATPLVAQSKSSERFAARLVPPLLR
ncbi:MAG: nuclear transport factor 2 family protein [Gaiellaceae bacterium]